MINRDVLEPKKKMRELNDVGFMKFMKDMIIFLGILALVILITFMYMS